MPYYQFECQNCGLRVEFFSSIEAKSTPVCDCGEMVEVWEPRKHKPFPAFVTTHIDGKPREITSLHEIRQLEKAHERTKLCWEPGSYDSKHGEL